jgi:GT2 family glycosyltransferase
VSTTPALGVVIPHHSRGELLLEAVRAVRGWPTWVVDDSPSGQPVGDLPPGTTVLRSRGEEGFARACNIGLAAVQAAGHPWALLLNDDARPLGPCLELLLAAVEADPVAGAAGPLLVDAAGRIESAGIRVHRRSARVREQRQAPAQTRAVDALSGACLLMASKERLDPAYRFGFEDIALCQRLQAAGQRVLLVPEARCEHAGGATIHRRSRAATRHALAGHLRLVGARSWQRPLVLSLALAQVIREGGPPHRLLGLWEGWRDSRGF